MSGKYTCFRPEWWICCEAAGRKSANKSTAKGSAPAADPVVRLMCVAFPAGLTIFHALQAALLFAANLPCGCLRHFELHRYNRLLR